MKVGTARRGREIGSLHWHNQLQSPGRTVG